MSASDGLLLIDKPQGWTSHDVVAAIRGRLPRGTKVGHTGTLDPMATGLLVLLVGRATKEAQRLQGHSKVYYGRIRLGVETETADMEGKVTRERPVPNVTPEALQALFDQHVGELHLPPPIYSAVKVQGRPLYDYARKGVAVAVKPRVQTVTAWKLLSWKEPEAEFRLSCLGGTYVRSLAVSVGEKLGCGGAVSELRREMVGDVSVLASIGAAEAKALTAEQLYARVLPIA